jgi:hypothetical protein
MSTFPDFAEHKAVIDPENCSPSMVADNKDKVFTVHGFSMVMNQPSFIVSDPSGRYNTMPMNKLRVYKEVTKEIKNVKPRNNRGAANTGAAESATSDQDNREDSNNE